MGLCTYPLRDTGSPMRSILPADGTMHRDMQVCMHIGKKSPRPAGVLAYENEPRGLVLVSDWGLLVGSGSTFCPWALKTCIPYYTYQREYLPENTYQRERIAFVERSLFAEGVRHRFPRAS